MKGVGKVEGWRVGRRSANDIEWEQTRGKRWVAVAKLRFGGGKIGYEVMARPELKTKVFKGAGSLNRALAAAKQYMVAHPGR